MVRSRISCFKRRLVFVWIVPLLLLGMYQTFVFGGTARVEKTGQTTSYSATGGEDGDLQKGVAWPNPRFTDKGNGTVKDNLTKLNPQSVASFARDLRYCIALTPDLRYLLGFVQPNLPLAPSKFLNRSLKIICF